MVKADASLRAVGEECLEVQLRQIIALLSGKRDGHVVVGSRRTPVLISQMIDLSRYQVGEDINGILELSHNVNIGNLCRVEAISGQLELDEIGVLSCGNAGEVSGCLCGSSNRRV